MVMDHSTKETALICEMFAKIPSSFSGITLSKETEVYEWWKNGVRHREDGPAVEYPNGEEEWWLNGKRHRDDGPAVIYSIWVKFWWLNGYSYSQEEWFEALTPEQQIKFLWNL